MSDTSIKHGMTEDEQTEWFLKTNGPPVNAFAPDAMVEELVHGKTEAEKWLYRTLSINGKQNDWLIKQVAGLKVAHRTIHTRLEEGDVRFKNIDDTLAIFTALRNSYLDRKKLRVKIAIGLLTLLVLPFLSIFGSEVVKHLLHWP